MNKIIASLLSALMALASLGVPVFAAPTLKNYPAFLGVDGQLDAYIVVGADAKVADVVGAIDVALSLASVSTQPVPVEAAGVVSVTGGVSLDTEAERLYLGDPINKVRQTLTGKDLEILGKLTFEDAEGNSYDYSQYIDVGGNTIEFVQEKSDEDPVIEIAMDTSSSNPLYTARIVFTKSLDFTSNNVKGKTITFFGTEFTISPDITDNTKLMFYKSAQEITLYKDEETTVTVGGKNYKIKVLGFSTTGTVDKVVLQINEQTDDVEEGKSKTIGGLKVYAKTITSWSQGAEGLVVLQVGSEKITFEHGQPVKLGEAEEEVEGTLVTISATSGTAPGVSSIEIAVFAPESEKDQIIAGEAFTDPVFGTFKVAFNGISTNLKAAERDKIEFRVSGDDKGYVRFPNIDGKTTTLYFAYADSTVNLADEKGNTIHVYEGAVAKEKEIIFLTPGNPKYTHIVQVYDIKLSDTNGYVQFKDLITGETYKTEEGRFSQPENTLDLIVDGKTYTVTLVEDTTTPKINVTYNDDKIVVYPAIELNNGETLAIVERDLQIGDDIAASTVYVVPTGCIRITPNTTSSATIEYATDCQNYKVAYNNVSGDKEVTVGSVTYMVNIASGVDVSISVLVGSDEITGVLLVEEKDDTNTQNAVIVTVTAEDKNINYDIAMTASKNWIAGTSDDDVIAYLDYYGTYAEKDISDSKHSLVTVWYPDKQVFAMVAIGENPQWTVTIAGKEVLQYIPITQAVALLDTEVTSLHKQSNLILVGGPAVNRLTADVYGLTYPTYGAQALAQGIEYPIPEGKAIIEVLDSPYADGKVVVVVAGWEAGNTRAATSVLQRYETLLADIDVSKVIVEGTSRETATITPA